MEADVIDTLAGIAAGSHLDSVRRTRRAVARENAQKSFDSLLSGLDKKSAALGREMAPSR